MLLRHLPAALALAALLLAVRPPESAALSRTRQIAGQMVFGTIAGSIAAFSVGLTGASMIECDDCDSSDPGYGNTGRGYALILLGMPTAYLLANTAAVHSLGRGLDKPHHGTYLSTLIGSAAGMALFAGLVAGTRVEDINAPVVIAALALPVIGSVAGYERSHKRNMRLGASLRPGGGYLHLHWAFDS